jgi:long-chain acyl-CoA synthetase
VAVPDYEHATPTDNGRIDQRILAAADEIARTLPAHQRIMRFHFREEELPKTNTLKVRRSLLREELLRLEGCGGAAVEEAAETASGPAATPALAFLRETLARLLPEPPPPTGIIPQTHLRNDLGLDSVGHLQLLALVEERYGITIPDAAAQAHTRVEDLLREIGEREPLEAPAPTGPWWRSSGIADPDWKRDGTSALLSLPVRWTMRGLLRLFTRSYIRVEARGLENIPARGPFIIAPNHSSHLDSAAILHALKGRRALRIAAGEDYFFSTPVKRWVFTNVFDAVPMDRRAGGTGGLQRCMEVLNEDGGRDEGLLVYPEGTRSLDGHLQPFKVGLGLMAVESGVPIVPTWVEGTHELLPKGRRIPRPGRVRVVFGRPLSPEREDDALADRVLRYQHYLDLTRHTEDAVRELGRRNGLT